MQHHRTQQEPARPGHTPQKRSQDTDAKHRPERDQAAGNQAAGDGTGANEAGARDCAQVLVSPLLSGAGFLHAFSTRQGGVSSLPALRHLNLSFDVGDAPEAVQENRRRFSAALGLPPDKLREVHQVHGSSVWCASTAPPAAGPYTTDPSHLPPAPQRALSTSSVEADAILGLNPDEALCVRTADCVPILLACPVTGWAAAVHAGWRGIVAGVVRESIRELAAQGVIASDLLAAVGPCIGPAHFEVGVEVGEAIVAALSPLGRPAVSPPQAGERMAAKVVQRTSGAKAWVDLRAAVTAQHIHAGCDPTRIEHIGGCTHAAPHRYFSHRRDRGHTGRHLAGIRPQKIG